MVHELRRQDLAEKVAPNNAAPRPPSPPAGRFPGNGYGGPPGLGQLRSVWTSGRNFATGGPDPPPRRRLTRQREKS